MAWDAPKALLNNSTCGVGLKRNWLKLTSQSVSKATMGNDDLTDY